MIFKSKINLFFLIVFVSMSACKSTKKIVEAPRIEPEPEIPALLIEEEETNFSLASFLSEYLNLKYPANDFSTYLYVSVKHQKMYLIKNDSILKEYIVSTAKNGVGNKINSFQTPLGLHTIKQKIGNDVPLGGVFEERNYNGKKTTIYKDRVKADADYVTTRILWLAGEEMGINKGKNVDSYSRYIYIHGTPEEGYIGEPASHGCIRMINSEVVELYNMIEEGTPVLILQN